MLFSFLIKRRYLKILTGQASIKRDKKNYIEGSSIISILTSELNSCSHFNRSG